jgi:hypothetical protein
MLRASRRLATAACSLFLLVVLPGCKQQPGSKCSSNGKFMCADTSSALVCQNGIVVSVACRGPKGCAGAGAASECDDDLAQEGDGCMMTLNENYACSTDHKTELLCKDGKFAAVRTCKGTKACTIAANVIHCDDSVADVGDACVEEAGDANYACSVDKKVEIVCKGGKFEESNSCRGAKGCWIDGELVHCDASFGRDGDVCRPVDNHACSEDAKSELKCTAQMKWTKKRDCKREGCKVKGNEIWCD